MNETLHGTGIDVHECPDCNAALERNVTLDWELSEPRTPGTYVPLVRCALCGYATGGAYGADTACELLETVGINIEDATPGERITPDIIRERSDSPTKA